MTLRHDDFPALGHFLGAYLHQDWDDDYQSTEMAFQDYLNDEPSSIAEVTAELTTVLESGEDDAAIEDLLRKAGSFYIPSKHGVAPSTWLAGLLDMCSGATDA